MRVGADAAARTSADHNVAVSLVARAVVVSPALSTSFSLKVVGERNYDIDYIA